MYEAREPISHAIEALPPGLHYFAVRILVELDAGKRTISLSEAGDSGIIRAALETLAPYLSGTIGADVAELVAHPDKLLGETFFGWPWGDPGGEDERVDAPAFVDPSDSVGSPSRPTAPQQGRRPTQLRAHPPLPGPARLLARCEEARGRDRRHAGRMQPV
jgi:hypothetical protein